MYVLYTLAHVAVLHRAHALVPGACVWAWRCECMHHPRGSLEGRLGRSSASPLGRESSCSGAVHELVQLELLPDQRAHVVGGGLVSEGQRQCSGLG